LGLGYTHISTLVTGSLVVVAVVGVLFAAIDESQVGYRRCVIAVSS
jgi:hypothetical protein